MKAEALLDSFIVNFQHCMGKEVGINVHSVGDHLVFCVRLWRPIFAWSCLGLNTGILSFYRLFMVLEM